MRMRLLIVGVAAVVLCGAGVIIALVDREDGPSADCLQVEQALRPWGRTMPTVYQNLPPDIEFDNAKPDLAAAAAQEAQAASDIRSGAQLVQSAELRARVNEVADGFDEISRSRLAPSAPSAPSKDYYAGTNRINKALNDIKTACPGID